MKQGKLCRASVFSLAGLVNFVNQCLQMEISLLEWYISKSLTRYYLRPPKLYILYFYHIKLTMTSLKLKVKSSILRIDWKVSNITLQNPTNF